MCACEPSFTCSKCRDTPADPRYLEDEREPEELQYGPILMLGEEG